MDGIDRRLLHDAAVGGHVAVEHAQGTHLGEGVVVCAAHLAVGGLGAVGQVLVHGAHDGQRAAVEQAGLAQLVHDHRHAAHGIQVNERARAGRLQLHQVRGARACRIPIVHGDGMARLLGDGGEVQHRVRGTSEGHIAFHGVMDGGLGDDVLDADALLKKLHDLHAGVLGQAEALGVHGGDGAVAGKRDAQSLAQAVHGVGGEHAGAGTAGGACSVLEVLAAPLRSWCRRQPGRRRRRAC